MDLYFRRQFAARANDFVRGNMGHTIAINIGNALFSRLHQELTRPLGEESYLAMDFILEQYGLVIEFDVIGGVMLIGKNPMPHKITCPKLVVTVPLPVFTSTFDAALRERFLMWNFCPT